MKTSKIVVFFVAMGCGLLFGAGLVVSAMVSPDKVLNFLDVLGHWDPSLALVMAGALLVTMAGFKWLKHEQAPWFSDRFQWPESSVIDRPLIMGAALFGVGWGLAGYCPGPGLTQFGSSLVQGEWFDPLLFLSGLIAGSIACRWLKLE